MKKIQPIDWQQLDTRANGKTYEDAIKLIFQELVTKVNELIEEHNRNISQP